MRRLLVLLLAGLVGVPPVHAGMLDTIKKATKTDVSRQDRTGMTLRGGVHLQTGEQPRSTTLWRGWSRVTDSANMYLIVHSSEDTANRSTF